MKGKVDCIKTNKTNGLEYGFIKLDNGQSIYFDSRSLSDGLEMSDFLWGILSNTLLPSQMRKVGHLR